ncbi:MULTISPECIES: hypothetical protein [unclassified Bradyrhizobium]|uniref:hypothetical protein n=1 Tax=Bradyrhizobium TaxID=374 RepID=UPI0028EEEE3E|nr:MULTISPECIES: hypothetical protein [unclassified Bradyrhizobium]
MAIDPTTLRTELESLTRELSQLLRGAGTPRDNPDAQPAAAGMLAAAIEVLDMRLSETDVQVERMIRDRPIVATASAFALGLAVGLLLRRT